MTSDSVSDNYEDDVEEYNYYHGFDPYMTNVPQKFMSVGRSTAGEHAGRGVFSVEKVLGQEKQSGVRWLLERLLENRFWHLPELSERFHRGVYLRHMNSTTPECGANLVVCAKKS